MYQDWQAHLVGVVQRQPAVPRPVHPPPGRAQRAERRDRPEHPESLTHSAASLRGKQYLPEDSYKDDLYLKAQHILLLTVVIGNIQDASTCHTLDFDRPTVSCSGISTPRQLSNQEGASPCDQNRLSVGV